MDLQILSSDFSSFPAEQQQKQTEIAICSQNCEVCNWLLIFAIDFWHFQLSLLKAHDSLQQSELEKFCKKFLENFSNWLSVSNWLYSIAHDPAPRPGHSIGEKLEQLWKSIFCRGQTVFSVIFGNWFIESAFLCQQMMKNSIF